MKYKYGTITQGTVLNNCRVEQYPGFRYEGIVVTARCDIAQCKVSRFYYLYAACVETWVKTEGVKLVAKTSYQKKIDEIMSEWKKYFPKETKIISDTLRIVKSNIEMVKPREGEDISRFEAKRQNTIKKLKDLEKYLSNEITPKLSEQLLKEEGFKVKIKNILDQIFKGSHTHYCFVPYASYYKFANNDEENNKEENEKEGLIVNLLDIDFLDHTTAEKIEKQEIDYNRLKEEDKEIYNKKFFLEKIEDIVFPENVIVSPYIEWIMQQFSHAFSRIGLDGFSWDDVSKHWKDKDFLKG